MKRFVLPVLFLVLPLFSLSQNNYIQSKRGHYQSQSFDEMVAPLNMYKQHYETSQNQFWEYVRMGNNAYESRSYTTAKMYYKRASDLNKQFKFVSQSDLDSNISLCDRQISAQENENKFWQYINLSNEAYEKEQYNSALSYCQQASNLNKKYNYVDQRKLNENIEIIKKHISNQQNSVSAHSSTSTQRSTTKSDGPVYGYNSVDNPMYYTKEDKSVKIKNISITDSYTIISMSWTNNYNTDSWCQINKRAAIYASGQQYRLIKAENIAYTPDKTTVNKGQTLSFKLYFPTIPKSTKYIDLIEDNESSWKFYDIQLKP